ncbi:MAG: hypothetical protein SGI88_03460 [Candidatus Hydrogenedentes bacterium]|nr:hypothetical protein [Candidatus Hydrogenedentota bacterium]
MLVQNWLNSATRDLCTDATARIRAEVEDHVNAACADWQAQGLSETDAFYKAFDTLGGSEAARARYVRQNFNELENKKIGKLPRHAAFGQWGAFIMFGLGVVLACIESSPINIFIIIVYVTSMAAFVPIFGFVKKQSGLTGHKMQISALIASNLITMSFIMGLDGIDIVAIVLAISAISYLRLARKLWRVGAR